ncbi:MAG: hypothetical protein IPN48_05000 [Sphingomonadales bacterium]|nr:hypothetical protein [Sphingomonadales bacterium]
MPLNPHVEALLQFMADQPQIDFDSGSIAPRGVRLPYDQSLICSCESRRKLQYGHPDVKLPSNLERTGPGCGRLGIFLRSQVLVWRNASTLFYSRWLAGLIGTPYTRPFMPQSRDAQSSVECGSFGCVPFGAGTSLSANSQRLL